MPDRFIPDQVSSMTAKLEGTTVRQRSQGGRQLSYVEGYHVINEANRIFGFGNWSTDVLDLRCVEATAQNVYNYQGREKEGYLIAYTATVRVTVHHEAGDQAHTDVGYGEGIEYSNVGQAHESAIKEAVTDAEKRALRHWGNPFGLALYDKDQRDVEKGGPAPTASQRPPEAQGAAPAKPDGPLITDAQARRYYALVKAQGLQEAKVEEKMQKEFSTRKVRELTRSQYDRLCQWIERHPKPEAAQPQQPAAEGQTVPMLAGVAAAPPAAQPQRDEDDDSPFAPEEVA